MAITLEITTPEGAEVVEGVKSATIPTAMGQITVLPGHQPILGKTSTGELNYTDADGKGHEMVVDNGFYVLKGDKLSMLVEGAVDTAQIDMEAIQKAQERAQAALDAAAEQDADPAEIEEFERIVRFSLAQRLAKQK